MEAGISEAVAAKVIAPRSMRLPFNSCTKYKGIRVDTIPRATPLGKKVRYQTVLRFSAKMARPFIHLGE